MDVTLYVVPGSHPCIAVTLMLDRKGIAFRQRWLVHPITGPALRARGFAGRTVPALRIDARRIQTSRAISRGLDELMPEPPLFPLSPQRRTAVETAERWGDEVLQGAARRIEVWEMRRNHSMVETQLADARRIQGARIPIPPALAAATSGPTLAWYARRIGATDEAVRRDLQELPAMLDHIDDLIAEDVLGAEDPNAADYQIAPSIRLLMTMDDLLPAIEQRPAAQLAGHLVPEYPGRSARLLPAEWLAPLRHAPP